MAYRISYGGEPKRSGREFSLIKYQAVAAVLLCLTIAAAAARGGVSEALRAYFVPDPEAAQTVFAQTVAEGGSWRSAAVDYCRQRLLESGYAP